MNGYYEAAKQIRGTWGNINPVTKIVPDKKKFNKKKTRKKLTFSENYDIINI